MSDVTLAPVPDAPEPEAAAAPPPAEAKRAPAPKAGGRDRLQLPQAGTRYAHLGLILGVVFYVVFGGGFLATLAAQDGTLLDALGLGADGNALIAALIALGLALVLFSVYSVFHDGRELAREEADVEWVHATGREWLGLVFAPPARREELRRRGVHEYAEGAGHVETLMDDRVRRVFEQQRNRYARFSPDEMRGMAETRTARYGSVARFASALLLLLAVLGTFAGVKTALPGLIDAVSAAGGEGMGDITGPLRAVSDAFGGNALALVGAIAVGLMAQGLAMGRRNLLERLELVSTEFLYGNAVADSADPLTEAVRQLSDTAASVRDAGEAMAGVDNGLMALRETFDNAFASLNQRLVEVAQQQERALHDRTSSELREMQRRVAELAAAVSTSTTAYQGIVDGVELRSGESRAAVEKLDEVLQKMDFTLQAIGASHQATATAMGQVHTTVDRLKDASDQAVSRLETVANTVEKANPAFHHVERALDTIAQRVGTVDDRAAQRWIDASDQVHAKLSELLTRAATQNGGSRALAPYAGEGGRMASPEADPEVAKLLRRVAQAVESRPEPSPWRTVGIQAAGILTAVAGFGLLWVLYDLVAGLIGGL